jgi:hypothetical protein
VPSFQTEVDERPPVPNTSIVHSVEPLQRIAGILATGSLFSGNGTWFRFVKKMASLHVRPPFEIVIERISCGPPLFITDDDPAKLRNGRGKAWRSHTANRGENKCWERFLLSLDRVQKIQMRTLLRTLRLKDSVVLAPSKTIAIPVRLASLIR